ncbi:5-methylcytosine-specific restriction protein B [Parabacteroides sp. PFB2-12]|uniref:AAA family ATPase n=1 Tax=unclassified Parabacteroides TaxID=2649774 RepID=UPI002474370E|nr:MULTISPECIES: AAA family ATPase [unclassified Parabacteroides]MDH6343747.1 5-methylcytosine-specific restriction protein B [Parabacteroides sp. PM6-13]MDH6391909.1 5-methylcytosine-specific restriction protein B [Parabacteroides sp. PFB2-12]
MADILCRWRNPSPQTVCELVSILPHKSMSSNDFRLEMDEDFFRTPYQLACQLGLYFEDKDKDSYTPRFEHDIAESEATSYLEMWIHRYYVPNPYTKSLRTLDHPIYLIEALVKKLEEHGGSYNLKASLDEIFSDEMGNLDIVRNTINKYSQIITVDNDNTAKLNNNYKIIMKQIYNRNDKKAFFDNFSISDMEVSNLSKQIIYYGAPGTGKSHEIKTRIKAEKASHTRTTFHPDSDYSTFVGAYKPTMEKTGVISNGKEETKISYRFVPQSFMQAYIKAWKNYPSPQYLIIEEINRGNCAQIFGDLFQLLDRNGLGFSDYPIVADNDLSKFIKDELARDGASLNDAQKEDINNMYQGEYDNVVKEVLNGNLLLLPSNLYIYATMNTSDQSLFPIDSAFKRRWDWQYTPITQGIDHNGDSLKWKIEVNGEERDWWEFLQAINKKIGSTTDSEDKKLGYFFIKAQNGIIRAETFVAKVIFYLWNDVFKDYGFDDKIFLNEKGETLSFPCFYEDCELGKKVNEKRIAKFIDNVLETNKKESDIETVSQ